MSNAEKKLLKEVLDAAVYCAGALVEPALKASALQRLEAVLPKARAALSD